MAPYTIDDLPRFSPWPARLLGLEPWEQRHKTPEEILREYEDEKWGPLLERLRAAEREIAIEEVDGWAREGSTASLCSIGERLELLSPREAHARYLNLVEDVLKEFLPASALVELGAGYGSIILALATRGPFAQMRVMAAEYAPSGVELLRCIAKGQRLEIEVGHCDFASSWVADMTIPQGALIFTSFATPYVPRLSPDFVKALCTYRPQAVVHLEPCYEHCNSQALLGLLRRRYIQVNDYNTNLVTLLHDQQERGLIRILEERPTVFGMNPLLAASVIAWIPQD